MEKILIIGCKRVMNDVCIACSRCMVGFNRREGAFSVYGEDAELLGILNCGDCPGAGIVPRLAQFKLWNAPQGEKPTKIHVAPCILNGCIYKEGLIATIREKAGVEVVEGGHPYAPADIFA